jgi:hypothetical protein
MRSPFRRDDSDCALYVGLNDRFHQCSIDGGEYLKGSYINVICLDAPFYQ